ncbi:MAG: CHAT domain-containing protein [Cytophagales bacterium]|nr:MAG: CHAT domain-containing protein [Cytophagales bacterium]
MKKTLILLFFNIFSATLLLAQDSLNIQRLYNEAKQNIEDAQYEEALSKFTKVAQYHQKQQKQYGYLDCQIQIARLNLRQGNLDLALNICEKVLIENQNAYPILEADVYDVYGNIYLYQGDNNQSIFYFEKALSYYNKFFNQCKSQIATCYNSEGIVYWNTGNNAKGLDFMQKALRVRKEIYGEQHPEVAAVYNNIGLIYTRENPNEALRNYEKALDIYQKVYDPNHPNIATTTTNIAIINRQQKKYETALSQLNQVLEIWTATKGKTHPNVAFIYTNLGQTYQEKNEFQKALEYQEKALEIYKANYGNKNPEIANTYNLIGNLYLQQENYEKALQSYQLAITSNLITYDNTDPLSDPTDNYKNYYNGNTLLVSMLSKAQTLETRHFNKSLKHNDLKQAFAILTICDFLVEHLRQHRTNKNDKIALGAIASEVYEDAIRVSLALSKVSLNAKVYEEKAFYFSEKNKSAVLLGSLVETSAKNYANIPESILQAERQFKNEIAYYEQQITKSNLTEVEEKTYRDKIFQLNEGYEKLIQKMESEYPQYYNLKYNINPITIEELQTYINKETVVISYAIADKTKQIYIFKITQNNYKIYEVTQTEDFNKYVVMMRNAIHLNNKTAYTKIAHTIYRELFPKDIPQNTEKVVIIPDGKLGILPFEALLTKEVKTDQITDYSKMPFLLFDHAISYAYSATLLGQNLQKNEEYKLKENNIFLCAPVEFDSGRLTKLPGTEKEVNAIGKIFTQKSTQAQILISEKAQEKYVKSNEIQKYKFLHFATHGVVNENNPELSNIHLKTDANNSEDGILYTNEIYNLILNAQLVTLSACETGLGKISKGEGVIGLTRALLYAGAQNIMVSFWKVADESTAELMVDFYEQMLNDYNQRQYFDFSHALRLAKIKMIQESDYASPYFWAPFILIGK